MVPLSKFTSKQQFPDNFVKKLLFLLTKMTKMIQNVTNHKFLIGDLCHGG